MRNKAKEISIHTFHVEGDGGASEVDRVVQISIHTFLAEGDGQWFIP